MIVDGDRIIYQMSRYASFKFILDNICAQSRREEGKQRRSVKMNKMERCAVGKSIFVSITFSEKRKEKLKSSTKATIEANIFPVCNGNADANSVWEITKIIIILIYRSEMDHSFFFFLVSRWSIIHGFYRQRGVRSRIIIKWRRRKNRGFLLSGPFHDIVSPPIWILVFLFEDLRIKGWRIVAIHFENCTRKNRVFNRGPLRAKNLDDLSR